jgi:hypothetical protein
MGLFYKKYHYQTPFSKAELLDRLQGETDTFDRDDTQKSFQGKVLPSGKFILQSLIDFHARNQFRPDIVFVVTDQNVTVTFQLSPTMKFFIPFLFLFNSGIGIFFYMQLQDIKFLLLFPFILVFMGMMALQFRSKTQKSVQVLERLFECESETI